MTTKTERAEARARAAKVTRAERAARKQYKRTVEALEREGKPLAAARHRRLSPLDVLKKRRVLNVWELTAADEIIAAYQIAAGRPVARDPDLGIVPGPPRPDGADDAVAHRCDLLVTYGKWKDDLLNTWHLDVTIRVLIEEIPLNTYDSEWGCWRKGTAKEHLLTGLRHFAALRGNIPRGVRGWKVAA